MLNRFLRLGLIGFAAIPLFSRAHVPEFTGDGFSYNGNWTADGYRAFEYDDENQSISVTSGASYRKDFVYDGSAKRKQFFYSSGEQVFAKGNRREKRGQGKAATGSWLGNGINRLSVAATASQRLRQPQQVRCEQMLPALWHLSAGAAGGSSSTPFSLEFDPLGWLSSGAGLERHVKRHFSSSPA